MKYVLGAYSQIPQGSSDKDFERLLNSQLKPLLTLIYKNPGYHLVLRLGVNEFEWLEKNHPEINMLIADLCRKSQLELLSSSYNDSSLSLLPSYERSLHVEKTTTFLRKGFGKRPRGLWCYHQVFNPSIIPVLSLCSLDYIIISGFNQSAGTYMSNRPFYMDELGKTSVIFPSDDKYSKEVAELIKTKENSERFLNKIDKISLNSTGAFDTIMINLDQLLCCEGSNQVFELLYKNLGDNSILPSAYLEEHEILKISYMPAGVYGRDFSLGKYNSVNQMIAEDTLLLRLYNLTNILRNSLKDIKKNADEKKLIESLFLRATNSAIYVSEQKNDPNVRENVLKSVNEIESILSDLNVLPAEADLDSDHVNELIAYNKNLICYINSKGAVISHLNFRTNNHDYAYFDGSGVFSDFLKDNTSQKTIDLSSRRFEVTFLDKKSQDLFAKISSIELGKKQIDLVKWFKLRQNSINVMVNIENRSNSNISNYSYGSDISLLLSKEGKFYDLEGNAIDKDEFESDSLIIKTENNPLAVVINVSEKCTFMFKNVFTNESKDNSGKVYYKYTQIKVIKKININADFSAEMGINIKFEKIK